MLLDALVENLTVREKGAILSTICLDLTVYSRESPLAPSVAPFTQKFYSRVRERLGSEWTCYETHQMEAPARVTASALDQLPHWCSGGAPRSEYSLLLRSGTPDDDIGVTAFELGALGKSDHPGFLRVSVPVSFLSNPGAAAYAQWCDDLVGSYPLLSAHAGFSLRWNEYGKRYFRQGLKHAELIAEWYPGIDLPDDSATILENAICGQIRPIGWLTYLSESLAIELGGASALQNDLAAPIDVRMLPRAIVIQAGARPETGNSTCPTDLNAYWTVGKRLSSVSLRRHAPIVRSMDAWLARFHNVARSESFV